MTNLTDRLDEIAARAEAATPGPWEPCMSPSGGFGNNNYVVRPDLLGVAMQYALVWTPGDAEFIANARTDLPALVAALRAVLDQHYDAGPSQGYDFGPDGGYGWADHCCGTCGTHGEYGVAWPCPTVQALADALGVEP